MNPWLSSLKDSDIAIKVTVVGCAFLTCVKPESIKEEWNEGNESYFIWFVWYDVIV